MTGGELDHALQRRRLEAGILVQQQDEVVAAPEGELDSLVAGGGKAAVVGIAHDLDGGEALQGAVHGSVLRCVVDDDDGGRDESAGKHRRQAVEQVVAAVVCGNDDADATRRA